mmetsp:Transcript_30237/g.101050  ORF Transcript_30237/g.101050 Transcript_30237/m.101050 type:complete len:405 (-) Transcript_30237:732-1946(-)
MAVGRLRRACLLLTGAAVEFGWAAGETVMIPHLVGGLNLSATIAGLVYVLNPCIGLVAQPAVGHASDRCTSRFGRRRPFLFFLGLLAVVGLQVVAWSHELAGRLGWGRQSEVVTVFASFTAMDCAHDLLLVPGRALAHDLLSGCGSTAESVDADFTAFQMAGRLLALLAGSAPLEALLSPRNATAPARASSEPDGSYRHFVALLNLSTLFLASAVTAALVAGAAETHAPTGERHAAPLLPAAASEAASALPPSAVAPVAGTEEEEAARTAVCEEAAESLLSVARRLPQRSRAQLALLLACQFLGWTLIQCQAFWWTEWVVGRAGAAEARGGREKANALRSAVRRSACRRRCTCQCFCLRAGYDSPSAASLSRPSSRSAPRSPSRCSAAASAPRRCGLQASCSSP